MSTPDTLNTINTLNTEPKEKKELSNNSLFILVGLYYLV